MTHAAKAVEMNKISIYITLGSGQDLGIDDDGHLVLIDYTGYRVDLGRATTRRLDLIQEYVGRLAIHAVEEKVI
ncbi:MAG: hypothetical protein EOQ44_25120 [Mesorhizobium sp.]|uniref:hypothetical protein n=1 Tax=Mesorhizobium sp. TaxID=1871066 RepID=UPI000FE9C836|nr:hypothetical protein [Mesorhizobium sp.]RWB40427.1 MAG: hypothetical protein EOQ44_25120 [Mesorhizobium sp.]